MSVIRTEDIRCAVNAKAACLSADPKAFVASLVKQTTKAWLFNLADAEKVLPVLKAWAYFMDKLSLYPGLFLQKHSGCLSGEVRFRRTISGRAMNKYHCVSTAGTSKTTWVVAQGSATTRWGGLRSP